MVRTASGRLSPGFQARRALAEGQSHCWLSTLRVSNSELLPWKADTRFPIGGQDALREEPAFVPD